MNFGNYVKFLGCATHQFWASLFLFSRVNFPALFFTLWIGAARNVAMKAVNAPDFSQVFFCSSIFKNLYINTYIYIY